METFSEKPHNPIMTSRHGPDHLKDARSAVGTAMRSGNMDLLRRAAMPVRGLAIAVGVSLFAGCGGGGGGGSTGGSGIVGASTPGKVQILLADTPVPGLTAVNVTFTKIEGLYDGEADSRNRHDDDRDPASVPNVVPDDNDQWVTLTAQAHTVN